MLKVIQENTATFMCSNCDYIGQTEDDLSKHQQSGVCSGALYCEVCVCGSVFTLSSSLRRHKQEDCPVLNDGVSHQCFDCGAKFTNKRNLRRHQKQVCMKFGQAYYKNTLLGCVMCDASFPKLRALIHHVEYHHDVTIDSHEFQFQSLRDFELWKCKEEKNTFSYFPRRHSVPSNEENGGGRKYITLYCQFHGSDKPHHKGPVGSKTRQKGRCKTGMICYAHMIAKTLEDGSVRVKYFSTHSHPTLPQNTKYQPLSKQIREEILRLDAVGFSAKEILQRLRCSGVARHQREEPRTGRESFLTLSNIVYLLKYPKRRSVDGEEEDEDKKLSHLVEELCSEDKCPVLLFKPCGKCVQVGSGIEYPANDVFILGLQTAEQLSVLQISDSIQIDILFDSVGFGVHVLSLVVTKDKKEFPVANFLCTAIDEDILQVCLSSLKDKTNPKHVLSSDDSVLQSVREVFGTETECHLSHSYVFTQWTKHLSHKSKSFSKEVSSRLRCILEEKSKLEFAFLCKDFLQRYRRSLPKLVKLLEKYYLTNEQLPLWSSTYREGKYPNTNYYVDIFHNLLQKKYFNKISDKGIDKLVIMLCEVEKDYYAKRILHKDEDLVDNVLVRCEDVITVDKHKWNVRCSDKKTKTCLVERIVQGCDRLDCHERPNDLCIHLYSCSCHYFNLLCSHIVKVHDMIKCFTDKREFETCHLNKSTVGEDEEDVEFEHDDDFGSCDDYVEFESCNNKIAELELYDGNVPYEHIEYLQVSGNDLMEVASEVVVCDNVESNCEDNILLC